MRANSSQGLLSAVGDGSGTSPIETALDRWTTAVDQFFKSYGDGFVSAVHWGARGSAKFTMSSGSSATSWAYGGAAQFSYAGPAVAVSLKAAYDGSSKSDNADVTVTVKGFYRGWPSSPRSTRGSRPSPIWHSTSWPISIRRRPRPTSAIPRPAGSRSRRS